MTETAAIAFATFFATIGPIDVAAMFSALTTNSTPEHRRSMAFRGILIAGGILISFALVGEIMLTSLGISLAALRTAGGILLLLIGIDMVFARTSGGTSTTLEEEQEAWTADAQIRWFFQKVQHPQLQANVAALEATRLLNPAMTLTTIANSLAANVSNLPEVVSMRARGISVIGTGQDKGRSGIHAADGSIYTGYYKTWGALTKEERGQVIAERSRLGIKSKTPGTGGGPKRRAAALSLRSKSPS